jgi:hypothetical protein
MNVLRRVKARPKATDWAPDELMTLTEAVGVFWPDGPLTVPSLRTEIRKGHLIAERIAGKLFVTPNALQEMRTRCQDKPTVRVSSSGSALGESQSTSSSTPDMKRAQVAAQMNVQERRNRLRTTSQKSMQPPTARTTQPTCQSQIS